MVTEQWEASLGCRETLFQKHRRRWHFLSQFSVPSILSDLTNSFRNSSTAQPPGGTSFVPPKLRHSGSPLNAGEILVFSVCLGPQLLSFPRLQSYSSSMENTQESPAPGFPIYSQPLLHFPLPLTESATEHAESPSRMSSTWWTTCKYSVNGSMADGQTIKLFQRTL